MSRCIAFIVCALCASTSFAQIYYEPVRYQHSACGQTYFYGGSDPHMIAHANYYACNTHFKRSLHNFDGGNSFNEPAPFFDYAPVYMDSVPRMDARYFGYTESDARNAAYAAAPRYFRKSDLLASAQVVADGSLVVPADAQPAMRVYVKPGYRAAGTMPGKGQIIIIPKRLLDRTLKSFEKKPGQVASVEP
jgi:hypothetical protein